jgi:hypothetical protein
MMCILGLPIRYLTNNYTWKQKWASATFQKLNVFLCSSVTADDSKFPRIRVIPTLNQQNFHSAPPWAQLPPLTDGDDEDDDDDKLCGVEPFLRNSSRSADYEILKSVVQFNSYIKGLDKS